MAIVFAYLAGVLTLINPCVLPVLPIVIASSLQTDGRAPLALAAGMGLSFVLFGTGVAARVITRLMADNPEYASKIRVIVVDWDQHGKGKLSRALKIPRRSTLVALKGHKEIGRLVAGTGKAEIKALFDDAMAAAG